MVQVRGVTYRIERTEPHCYTVVRLLDDTPMGSFRTLPGLRLHPEKCELLLFREIVRAVKRAARTSAVMQVAPVYAPEEEPAAAKSPSTVPPRPALA